MKKYLFTIIIGSFLVASSAHAACVSPNATSIRFGTKSNAVVNLQNCLIEKGYTIGGVATGYYGSLTLQAVKSLYKDTLGLVWDGRSIGPKGIQALLQKGTTLISSTPSSTYRYVKDDKDLQTYINQSQNGYAIGIPKAMTAMTENMGGTQTMASDSSRVSQTNVQVSGIDEADILKTDGKNLFMSKPSYWYTIMPFMRMADTTTVSSKMAIMPPYPQESPKTQIIGVSPLSDLGIKSDSIDLSGEMLYEKISHTLIVFGGQAIGGYNVTDPVNPKKIWTLSLENNTRLVTSRLKDGKIYLVTSTWLNNQKPCPVIPLMSQSQTKITIPCNQILIPETLGSVSQLYTIMQINPNDGSLVKKIAIAEQGYNATIAMFDKNIYLATQWDSGYNKAYTDIYTSVAKKFVPQYIQDKISKILGYDLSTNGKLYEIQIAVGEYISTLSSNDQTKLYADIQNEVENQKKIHVRELYRTKLARISLDTLTIGATTTIPGSLVNQFAIDEYNGSLRVATTAGERWGGTSTNDVYVLNMNLQEQGSIKDMGLTERIYSVRFMGDIAYLVTFRQTDPFYVLNLKNPSLPFISGELKIPGYSSYLEDLGNGMVLGIGRESGDMKLSLFDVNNPKNPTEISKYILKNNWSEAENNHHAFLHDPLHKIFFIPGSDGGHIFSYENNSLSLKKTVAGNSVKRALYIDNMLYVISDTMITVVNENTWQVEKEFEIK